jgi:hypothetical protein
MKELNLFSVETDSVILADPELRVIFKEFIMTVLEVDSEKADQMLEAGKK